MFFIDELKTKAESIGMALYYSRENELLQSKDTYNRYIARQCRNFSKTDIAKIGKAAAVYRDYFMELEELQRKCLKKVNDILMDG